MSPWTGRYEPTIHGLLPEPTSNVMSVVVFGAETMVLKAGERLGPYEILGLIGAGGMGEVDRARDTRLGQTVAIKVIPEDLATHQDRLRGFEHEARATAALSHPNILAL
jgi:serine/threonine protein kinase